ncbi:MAG TPA: DUF2306 domain-containing protein [Steroidobacteraceae bacterium]
MQTRLAKWGMGFMVVSSLAVGLYSLRFFEVPFGHWAAIDAGIRGVIDQDPVRALMHMLVAPLALILGALQFVPKLRASHPKFHRYVGRIYVACCVIAGIGALAIAPHASGGPIAGLGFGILAVLWIGTTVGGMWAAMQRKFELHRLLMRLSYAMTFGGVTLRLQIPIGFMLGYASYSAVSVWLAYTSWLQIVVAVGVSHASEWAKKRRSTDG